MRVLAIDTSTARGSVAVTQDGDVLGEVRFTASDSHSTSVLGAVHYLLGALELEISQIDGLALAIGPGSFTGLRVGIATVQGLSLGTGRPIAGIPTLDALAARISGAADRLVVLMEAYRDGVNVGVYDRQAQPIQPPQLLRPDEILSALPPAAAFIGEAARRLRPQIQERCPAAFFPERSLFLAATVGRLALPILAAGQGIQAEELRPLYLREPHIGPKRA